MSSYTRNERGRPTDAQDVYGTRIRLTRDGLVYGGEFVPLAEVGGVQPESHNLWNPATSLFEVTVLRRNKPDLTIKNLPQQTAEQLRQAIISALRDRQA